MRTSVERLIFLFVVFGAFSVGAAASCKAVDVPDKYPHSAQKSAPITSLGASHTRAQSQTHYQTPTQTQAQSQNQGEQIHAPSFEEMITPNMKRFIMVYQTLLEGETEPCG